MCAERSCRTVALSVAAAVALGPAAAPTAAGEAVACASAKQRHEHFAVFAPQLDRWKRIWAYLPPDYHCSAQRRYPVFYFNDGHDLFDWNPVAAGLDPALAAEIEVREGWYGSWRLDAQLDTAATDGRLPPMIVVGIGADDGWRSTDLAPVPWIGSSYARGLDYGRFLAETLVPLVDARYRTITHRGCRGIGGASMGGISALQVGLGHVNRFGAVLAFSPVLGDPALAGYLANAWMAGEAASAAFLIDFDDDPLGRIDRDWFIARLAPATPPGRQLVLVQTPGGRHAIASWARRVVPALETLSRAGWCRPA